MRRPTFSALSSPGVRRATHQASSASASSRAFQGYFIKKWHRTLAEKERAWPGRYDFTAQRRLRSFVDMTRHFVEAHTEYPRMEDYFAHYTLTPDLLQASPTPLAIVTSTDDAVIPIRDFDGLAVRGSVVAYDRLDRGPESQGENAIPEAPGRTRETIDQPGESSDPEAQLSDE
jgi:hypothetical protein